MKLVMKYVTARRNANGEIRYYWQRKGAPLVRLPDDPAERYGVAMRLNAEHEGRKEKQVPAHKRNGTIAWLIDGYENSDEFAERAKQTQVSYRTWLRRIGALWGDFPAYAITRPVIIEWVDTIASKGNKKLAAAVLSKILGRAYNRGIIQENPALKLELESPEARHQYFTDEQIERWLTACAADMHADKMRMAFHLMLYTGQRPSDCLAMPWTRYDGASIQLRQEKTKKLLSIPTHRILRSILDGARGKADSTLLCGRLTYRVFNMSWVRICARAGIADREARDLRRTAVVQLAEAGCTEIEISAITGHALKDVRSILDSAYLTRTDAMGLEAVRKWENRVGTKSNGALGR